MRPWSVLVARGRSFPTTFPTTSRFRSQLGFRASTPLVLAAVTLPPWPARRELREARSGCAVSARRVRTGSRCRRVGRPHSRSLRRACPCRWLEDPRSTSRIFPEPRRQASPALGQRSPRCESSRRQPTKSDQVQTSTQPGRWCHRTEDPPHPANNNNRNAKTPAGKRFFAAAQCVGACVFTPSANFVAQIVSGLAPFSQDGVGGVIFHRNLGGVRGRGDSLVRRSTRIGPELPVSAERTERQELADTIAVEAPAGLLRVGLADRPSAVDALEAVSLCHVEGVASRAAVDAMLLRGLTPAELEPRPSSAGGFAVA